MEAYRLRPWSDVVRLHPDVEAGSTAVATYAIDLGALVARDPNVPAIYRNADSFFRATYLTGGLRRLLEEVLSRLAGKEGDRVLQLRSPFGGGKSHTLAALYYAVVDRRALDVLPEARGLPDIGPVRVAVFDGEKFDAVLGRTVEDGLHVRTVWGWLAWQLGGLSLFDQVAPHDERRVAPGGDVIARLLGNEPTLLLLDEVLKFLERAAGERVADSTLERQTLEFIHSLSVEVAKSPRAVLVYSLQKSAREALDNIRLLETLDHLTSRVDAKREPVAGDEILSVLQRRLLAATPDAGVAAAMADAYEQAITRTRVAHADSEGTRRTAEEEGLRLRSRLKAAYPFHPALIDLMKERWASLPDFQRTRGALRFLAACLHSRKAGGGAGPLLGPGDVPIRDGDVRHAFFTEVGQREPFQAVLEADLTGPNARAARVDQRLARESAALSSVQPAMKLATAILMYSFGGHLKESRKADGGEVGETLPPGVSEAELLAACVGPELDSITAQSALKGLREQCLYLHYDGARYVFKTTPNVTKLIEDEAESVRPEEIRDAIEEELKKRLAGNRAAVVWPAASDRIDDGEPTFLLAYLPLEFTELGPSQQEQRGREYLEKHGSSPRRYRNGLGMAIPNRDQLEPLRRAARYLIAIGRVERKKRQLGVTREQEDQLKERRQTEQSTLESALRGLYTSVWLLKLGEAGLETEQVEPGGRPLQATGIHERLMELLTTVKPKLFGSLAPGKIVTSLRLGERLEEGSPPRVGTRTKDVVDAFFGSPGFPRLLDDGVIKKALARGVAEGVFAYSGRGEPPISGRLSEDGPVYQVRPDQVVIGRPLAEDEIDLEGGFLILPQALPTPEPGPGPGPVPPGPTPPGPGPTPPGPGPVAPGPGPAPATTTVCLSLTVTQQQLFASFNAIGNLADKAGKVTITVEASKAEGFDEVWLRNAVFEPLEEEGIGVEGTS